MIIQKLIFKLLKRAAADPKFRTKLFDTVGEGVTILFGMWQERQSKEATSDAHPRRPRAKKAPGQSRAAPVSYPKRKTKPGSN